METWILESDLFSSSNICRYCGHIWDVKMFNIDSDLNKKQKIIRYYNKICHKCKMGLTEGQRLIDYSFCPICKKEEPEFSGDFKNSKFGFNVIEKMCDECEERKEYQSKCRFCRDLDKKEKIVQVCLYCDKLFPSLKNDEDQEEEEEQHQQQHAEEFLKKQQEEEEKELIKKKEQLDMSGKRNYFEISIEIMDKIFETKMLTFEDIFIQSPAYYSFVQQTTAIHEQIKERKKEHEEKLRKMKEKREEQIREIHRQNYMRNRNPFDKNREKYYQDLLNKK